MGINFSEKAEADSPKKGQQNQ